MNMIHTLVSDAIALLVALFSGFHVLSVAQAIGFFVSVEFKFYCWVLQITIVLTTVLDRFENTAHSSISFGGFEVAIMREYIVLQRGTQISYSFMHENEQKLIIHNPGNSVANLDTVITACIV